MLMLCLGHWYGCRQQLSVCFSGGSISHDKAANAKAYGTHVTPEDNLSYRVDQPPHMKDFYLELSGLVSGVFSEPSRKD